MTTPVRLAFFVLALTISHVLPLPAQQTANIVVTPNQILGPVNRMVFGHNIDAADNSHIFTSNTTDMDLIQAGEGFWDPVSGAPVPYVVNASKAVGMSMLRYPGGCLAHNYDWRKSVGPDAKKAGWLFGLDEYLSLCHTIGATPVITVSDYVLPAEQMPENAAGLVEYLNSPADAAHPWALKRKLWGHPAPYNVTWFELGNESMHGNHRVLPFRQYSAEQYAAYANATAAAMRKVDPRIKIGILAMPGPGTDVTCDWNQTVLRLAGSSADFFILHVYAPMQLQASLPVAVRMQAMMVAPQHVAQRLAEYHQMIRKQVGHDLPLAITEYNGALDESEAPYRLSYADALECADLLRVFLKPESNVAFANFWSFLNGPFGMLRTPVHSSGYQPNTEGPAIPLYALWAQHFGTRLVSVAVQAPGAEFPGAGSEAAASGTTGEPRRQLQSIDLAQYSSVMGSLWPKLLNVQIQRQNADYSIHLQNLSHSIYPTLALIPRPQTAPGAPIEFTTSFDARFTPDAGSETPLLGIGLMDSRGWNQTHSGLGVDGVSNGWKHFTGTYQLTPQTPSVEVAARLVADGKNISGTLEVHNLVVTASVSAHDAEYPLLTSSASLSADGKTLYLVVFNKSATDATSVTIHLPSFAAATARYWEVNGPALEATGHVTQTQQATVIPLSDKSSATHVFPAHSMTAIEFTSSRR